MEKWSREKVNNYCSLSDEDFEDITFVASDFDNWSSFTIQKKFEDNGSVHLGPNPRRVSVCSQYLHWLSGLFTANKLPPKTLADVEIWETRPSCLFLLFASDAIASEAYRPQKLRQVSCEVKELDIQPLHQGNPLDLRNAAEQMSIVQTQMANLNMGCQSINVLNVIGLYGDALMLWSPFNRDPTGKELLTKARKVVFIPGSIVSPIKASECPKIDKFLADNPRLQVCFENYTFELSRRPEDNLFVLNNRAQVTVVKPNFVQTVDGISTEIPLMNPAQQLSNFARAVL